jgi:hypothetical protein
MNKLIDLTNKRYGKLLVINHSHITKTKHNSSVHHWKCKCDCGNIKTVRGDCLTRKVTKSCGCINKQIGKLHPTWKGYGDISSSLYKQYKWSAKTRKINFDLTIKQIWDLYLKQNTKCAITNLQLTFPKNALDTNSNASLDRIDSSKGYSIDNVQWVDKRINFMKITLKNDEFIELCKLVAHHNSIKGQVAV